MPFSFSHYSSTGLRCFTALLLCFLLQTGIFSLSWAQPVPLPAPMTGSGGSQFEPSLTSPAFQGSPPWFPGSSFGPLILRSCLTARPTACAGTANTSCTGSNSDIFPTWNETIQNDPRLNW